MHIKKGLLLLLLLLPPPYDGVCHRCRRSCTRNGSMPTLADHRDDKLHQQLQQQHLRILMISSALTVACSM